MGGELVRCPGELLSFSNAATSAWAIPPPRINPTISYPTFWWLPNSSSNYRYIFCLVFISKLLPIPPVKVLLQTYPVAAGHVGWSWIQRDYFRFYSSWLIVIDTVKVALTERERVVSVSVSPCLAGVCVGGAVPWNLWWRACAVGKWVRFGRWSRSSAQDQQMWHASLSIHDLRHSAWIRLCWR